MIIKGGTVFREDGSWEKKDLFVDGGRIADCPASASDEIVLSAEGLLVLPGLIDIHSHGAMGQDVSDGNPQDLERILAYELENGITSYCPTTMTLPREKLLRVLKTVGEFTDRPGLAHVLGINMEGPFLDPAKKGAHREDWIAAPDPAFFETCQKAAKGRILLTTVAPDREGALELIADIGKKVTVSLGHTSADYGLARRAFQAGATHVTHLFNAMPPLNHRAPGLVGAASETPDCMAELICDGIHVHESAVRAAFRLFPGRIVLISDSMRAAGMADGIYDLGGQQVRVRGGRAALADGTIAGSAANLFQCMKNAVAFGIPLEDAITAATANPAKSIGVYGQAGSLSPGKRADILLTDKDLNLVKVLQQGEVIHSF